MNKVSAVVGLALSLSSLLAVGNEKGTQSGNLNPQRSNCDMHIGLVYFASISDSAVVLHHSGDSFQTERSESKQHLQSQIQKTVKACSTQSSAHKLREGSLGQRLDQLCEDAVMTFVRSSRIYGFALQRSLGLQGRPILASLVPQLRETQTAIYLACGWDVSIAKQRL